MRDLEPNSRFIGYVPGSGDKTDKEISLSSVMLLLSYTGYGPVPNPAVRAGGSVLGASGGSRVLGQDPRLFYTRGYPR